MFVPQDLKKFMEVFRIKLIPRFILLDQELNIITANMTAPSDSETKKRLNQLEGI